LDKMESLRQIEGREKEKGRPRAEKERPARWGLF
jgi:hypothetical protein